MKNALLFGVGITFLLLLPFRGSAQQDVSLAPWEQARLLQQRSHLVQPHPFSSQREELAAYTLSEARYSSQYALYSIDRFVRSFPLDFRREQINLYRGARYLHMGEYRLARFSLEQVDERSLAGDALAEWRVRSAYALMRTESSPSSLRPLFVEASSSKSYWGCVATLYLAGEYLSEGYVDRAETLYRSLSSHPELGFEAQVGLVVTNYYAKRYAEAVKQGEQLFRREPSLSWSHPFLLATMGKSLYRLERTEEAVKFFSSLFEQYQSLASDADRLLYGASLMELGRASEAQTILRPATTALDPIASIATLYLARALDEEGKYSEAIAAYESVTAPSVEPSVREMAMYEMAVVLHASGQSNFGQDVRIAETFLADFPASAFRPSMERFLLQFYYTNSDYAFSLASIRRLKERSAAIREAEQFVLNRFAEREIENANYSKAEELLKQAMAKSSSSGEAYGESLLLLALMYEKAGNAPRAIEALRSFITLPASANASNLSEAFYRLGYLHFNRQHYAEAVVAFNSALARASGVAQQRRADLYERLGDCHFAMGRLNEALTSYDLALGGSKQSAYSLSRKAEILGIRKQYTQQIQVLDEILSLKDSDSYKRKAQLAKGTAYQMAGNNRQAEDNYKLVARSYAPYEEGREASLRLALLYYNTNRTQATVDEYNSLIARAPESREARVAFESLKSIGLEEGRLDVLDKALSQSKGNFKLSGDEARNFEYEVAKRAYAQKNSDAKERLNAFLTSYPTGADANTIRLMLAELYIAEGLDGVAYSQYVVLEEVVEQLATAQRASLYYNMAQIEERSLNYKDAFSHYTQAYDAMSDMQAKSVTARQALQVATTGELLTEGTEFATKALATTTGDQTAILLARGKLYLLATEEDKALADLRKASQDGTSSEGAEATVLLAEVLIRSRAAIGEAKKLLQHFVKKGSSDAYWLARGYIMLAEAFALEGDAITAKQYLHSLEKNYLQTDDDIPTRIEQVLNSLQSGEK